MPAVYCMEIFLLMNPSLKFLAVTKGGCKKMKKMMEREVATAKLMLQFVMKNAALK